MGSTARRQQPPITIRSARAAELLRILVRPGHSQAEVIEQALEQMAARRVSLAEALTPPVPLDFDWEPPRSNPQARGVDFAD